MVAPALARYAAVAVGGFQILANGALLARGLTRMPAEILKERATPRIANLLRTSWIYAVLANLCVSGLLLLIAPALGRAEPLAQRVALTIAVYYLVVGVATYARSHPAASPASWSSACSARSWPPPCFSRSDAVIEEP